MLSKSSANGLFIVIFVFIFNLPLFEQTAHQYRSYVYVATKMTWEFAQTYCREHHTDLATFRNRNELDALQTSCLDNYCWIGLQRVQSNNTNSTGLDVWNWSDGEKVDFIKWQSGQPNNFDNIQNCVVMKSLFWYDANCEASIPFLCYDNLILVKENKTWEEALEHCRTLETDSTSSKSVLTRHFDLPHMDFGVRNSGAEEAILDSQTAEVWIGLRFLAGEWLWVNGMPLLEQLPACPPFGLHCGTMSKKGKLLPMRDCLERRNFLCSKRY